MENDEKDKKDTSSHSSPPSSSPHVCEWTQGIGCRVGTRSNKKGNGLKPYNGVKEYVKSVPICRCSCGFVKKKDTDECEMIKDLIIWEERTRKKRKMEMRKKFAAREEEDYEDLYYNHLAKQAAAKRKLYRDLSSLAEDLKDDSEIQHMLDGEADDIHKNVDRECLRYLPSSKIEEGR